MSIELHIERLVIDAAVLGGEPPASVQAAIERELARQLARPGAVDALRRVGAVAALPPALLPIAARPHQCLGARIASAVQHRLDVASGMHHARGAGHA